MAERWLLADLGGTNTRVGLGGPEGLISDSARSFPNAGFEGLAPLLRAYLDQNEIRSVRALCAGVAGPVRNGTAKLTNLDWFIDSTALAKATGATHIRLINDIQAQGYALDDLAPDHLDPLCAGADAPRQATRLVMGIGTGSNVAVVHHIGARLFVPPAESGHATLPHIEGALASLISHLGTIQPHRPIEAAISGPGLQNIWRWFGGKSETPSEIIALYRSGDGRAEQSIQAFGQILGQVAGDLALAHLPMGGLYLFGGTGRAIAPLLKETAFHTAFCAKGPYSDLLRDIPVFLIADDTAALRGCARLLRQELTT